MSAAVPDVSREERARPTPSGVGTFLDAALRRAADGEGLRTVVVPAPVVEPSVLAELAGAETLVAWEPESGPREAGVGEAARIRATGVDRFAQVEREAHALSASHGAFVHPDARDVTLRFFGGFAFDVDSELEPAWEPFGQASFVVPRWAYRRDGGRAELRLHVRADEARVHGEAYREAFDWWLAALGERVPTNASESVASAAPEAEPRRVEWRAAVEAALARLGEGAVEKVVLARREIVRAESPFDAVTVLRRLRRSYPECFTFALRHAGQTFLGASPERLIAKRGLSVVTEALAGSISVTAENASDRLRASQKDLREHASVVRHVVERIESLATDLRFDAAPTVRALPNVLHLVTPIVATLDAPTHVLALVAALHPTPAVGGTPQRAAMEWIRAHEPVSRGWYAGPVGWFDDQGDGEFAVALRSGLLRGDEAWIFAGAGLVRGSDPDAEFDETALKLRPLLGALGVSA